MKHGVIAGLVWITAFLYVGGHVVCSFAATDTLDAAPSNFPVVHASLQAAYEGARDDDTPVLVIFRAAWDLFSRVFTETTLESTDFIQSGVPVHIALLDVDEHTQYAKEFEVKTLPDLILLTADGKILDRRNVVMNPLELLTWISETQKNASQGNWMGIAPSSELGALLETFATRTPSSDDYAIIIEMLGSPVPGNRILAAQAIMSQEGNALPFLIEAANTTYLSIRVGVHDALIALAPDAPVVDPWASEPERAQAVTRLRAWWEDTGQNLPVSGFQARISDLESVRDALQSVLSDDPVQRTAAMTFLVKAGKSALPVVRDAIVQAESRGDHQSVWLLEDVRWAILVPPQVTEHLPDIRRTLSRGSSQERQTMTEQLGNLGASALPVLAELLHDSDPLVQERALHALTTIDADQALTYMAELLKSDTANLRMVAAQLLGGTKKPEAAQYLVPLLNDPEEVVATTAIAALIELKAEDAASRLINSLRDPRWRVRAAAAEALGKLEISAAADALRQLLYDNDPFVVKTALVALDELEEPVKPEEANVLIRTSPDLLPVLIQQAVDSETRDALQLIGELFKGLDQPDKIMLLDMLAQEESHNNSYDENWKPLLKALLADPDAAIRLHTVEVLKVRTPELAAEFTAPLLEDDEASVRQAGASLALELICYDTGYERDSGDPSFLEKMKIQYRHNQWHALLQANSEDEPDLETRLAAYLTDVKIVNVGPVQAAFTADNVQRLLQHEHGAYSLGLLLARLPWPQNEAWIRESLASPDLHAAFLIAVDTINPQLRALLLEPEGLLRTLPRISEELRGKLVEAFLSPATTVSLVSRTRQVDDLTAALLRSADPFARTLGVTAAAAGKSVSLDVLRSSLTDADPWVRRAAVMGIAARSESQEQREEFLGPLLSDPAPDVIQAAIIALLDNDIRRRAGLDDQLPEYMYQNVEFDMSEEDYYYRESFTRPLTVIPRNPAFLDQAQVLFETSATSGHPRWIQSASGLLMAQYGRFEALELGFQEDSQIDQQELLLVIELSRDARYLPGLREFMTPSADKRDLRAILSALRMMRGEEARTLRREINARLRRIELED